MNIHSTIYKTKNNSCLAEGKKDNSQSKTLLDYTQFIGIKKTEELLKLGEELKGLKIQQINSARFGGGVAEMLQSLIPLEKAMGLDVDWKVITGDTAFFNYTKGIHNFLQGKVTIPGIIGTKNYWDTNRENFRLVDTDAEIMLIHDPQPAGLIMFLKPHLRVKQKWVWRCHVQLLPKEPLISGFLKDLIELYDTAIFSSPKFLPSWKIPYEIMFPYIDPLSNKNRELTEQEIQDVLDKYGIEKNTRKKLIVLVSRFDPFKGHLATIEAFNHVRKLLPCQLLMAGGTAGDDPENKIIFELIEEKTKKIPDITLLNLPPDSHTEINAFQRAADIIIQPSTKEGFGLTVSEGMWKEKPVIGCNVGGIPAQIIDGYNGFLIDPGEQGIPEMIERIICILENPSIANVMGKRGKQGVKERFLITRGIYDELCLFKNLIKAKEKQKGEA